MPKVSIDVPASVSEEEAVAAMAMALYGTRRISQGEAAAMCGLSRLEFFDLLARHGQSFTNITVEDLEEELQTWREFPSRTAPP